MLKRSQSKVGQHLIFWIALDVFENRDRDKFVTRELINQRSLLKSRKHFDRKSNALQPSGTAGNRGGIHRMIVVTGASGGDASRGEAGWGSSRHGLLSNLFKNTPA